MCRLVELLITIDDGDIVSSVEGAVGLVGSGEEGFDLQVEDDDEPEDDREEDEGDGDDEGEDGEEDHGAEHEGAGEWSSLTDADGGGG